MVFLFQEIGTISWKLPFLKALFCFICVYQRLSVADF